MLDQRLVFEWIDTQHTPALALIPARDHPDLIVLLQLNTYRFRRFTPRPCHQITSGARETIFINFLSRSSRATAPKTSVPTASPVSLMSTAPFDSHRIYAP